MKKERRKTYVLIGVVGLVCIVVLSFLLRGHSEGVKYIQSQEKRDLTNVSAEVSKDRAKERKKAIREGKLDAYALLDDFVFYGDSRVLHYNSYGFIDAEHIFADNGETFADVPKYNDRLKEKNPKTVLIAYGVNDIYYQAGKDVEGGYPQLVRNSLEDIHKIVPKATIYVCGMIPISPYGLQRLNMTENSGEFNATLKSIVDEYDYVKYIDDETLSVDGLADIYAADGYHFQSNFYEEWTQYIVSCIEQK